jgi:hypothetical protein
MIHKTCPWLLCAVLASTTAWGAEFEFAARVTVLQTVSVTAVPAGDALTVTATLVPAETQDRCLDVCLRAAERPRTGPAMFAANRSATTAGGVQPVFAASLPLVAPDGATVQINLN